MMRPTALLKSKNLYLLYWLPFVLAGIVAIRSGLGVAVVPCDDRGIISLPFRSGINDNPWLMGGVLLLLSLAVFWVADKYKFLGQRTALPALVYMLLAVGFVSRYGVNDYLLAAACMIVAIGRLQAAILYTKQNASLFDFGMCVTLSVLLCPKLVMLVPWAMVVLPFSGRAMLKDMVAFLIGVAAVCAVVCTYYFYSGELSVLEDWFVEGLLEGGDFWSIYPGKHWVFVLLALQVVILAFYVLLNFSSTVIAQRRGILAMFSLLLFLGSSLFFIPFNCHGIMMVISLPLSYLFSQYFISHRHRWVGIVLLVLFVVTCIGFIV